MSASFIASGGVPFSIESLYNICIGSEHTSLYSTKMFEGMFL